MSPTTPNNAGKPALSTTPASPSGPLPNHRDGMETLAKAASIVCSGAAGLAVATGLMDPSAGTLCGIVVPVTAGFALAGAVGLGWHSAHTAARRVRTPLAYVAVTTSALALSAATIGASSWAIATVLSGHAAQRQNMSLTVTAHQQALDDAWAQASTEAGMIDAVGAARNELQAMSEIEAQGGGISKKGRGNGSNAQLLAAGAKGYARLGAVMQEKQDEAERLYAAGTAALTRMRSSLRSDPAEFGRAAATVESTVAALNAHHLTPLANKAGLVSVEVWSVNGTVQAIKSGAEQVGKKVEQRAKTIAKGRSPVPVPVYEMLEPREATLRYATEAALGGWVTAVALDCIPLLFTGLLLGTQARGQLDEPVRRRNRDSDGQDHFEDHGNGGGQDDRMDASSVTDRQDGHIPTGTGTPDGAARPATTRRPGGTQGSAAAPVARPFWPRQVGS